MASYKNTPRWSEHNPPDFTTNGILVIMAALPLMGVSMTIPVLFAMELNTAFIFMPILFAIFAVVSLVIGRGARAAIEVPTQKVRSIAIGDAEVIGQVRPLRQPPTVVVDNDPSKTAEGLVVWNWLYDVYIEETYINSDGERETRTYWRDIDSESGTSHSSHMTARGAWWSSQNHSAGKNSVSQSSLGHAATRATDNSKRSISGKR